MGKVGQKFQNERFPFNLEDAVEAKSVLTLFDLGFGESLRFCPQPFVDFRDRYGMEIGCWFDIE
jgi:hypothetical protein